MFPIFPVMKVFNNIQVFILEVHKLGISITVIKDTVQSEKAVDQDTHVFSVVALEENIF